MYIHQFYDSIVVKDQNKNDVVVFKKGEIDLEKLEKLVEIAQDLYSRGFNDGNEKGKDEGYEEGYEEGKEVGYAEGYNAEYPGESL